MTKQTPVTAEIEKWLRDRVRFFPNFWLRVRKKNSESCRNWLRYSGPVPPLLSAEMNMDLDINPTDVQFFYGFGLDLDFIISDYPDLDLDLIILFKFFITFGSVSRLLFLICAMTLCVIISLICVNLFKFCSGSAKLRRH